MKEINSSLYIPYAPVAVEPVTSPLQSISVDGKQLTTSDGPITLKGTCVTAQNREDFIYGFPGTHTELMRKLRAVDEDKARAFDETLRHYSFREEDARFIASSGANVVRWSLNYQYFTDDQHPEVFKEDGFEELDNAVDMLGKYGVYTILDFHAVPGGQNPDWHSDNASGEADFWNYRVLRDWQLRLVRECAARYQGNANIAAFDLLNEPQTMAHGRDYRFDLLNEYYQEAVATVRSVDPDRVCILEGDGYSSRCKDKDGQGEVRLIRPFTDNLVYSVHPYYPAALGRGVYPGDIEESYYTGEVVKHFWDKEKYARVFQNQQMVEFARDNNVPLFAGEFGAAFIYEGEERFRLKALLDQIEVFNEYGDREVQPIHRTIWEAKDTGDSGIVRISPDSAYAGFIQDTEQVKDELKLEWWKRTTLKPSEIDTKLADFTDYYGNKLNIPSDLRGKLHTDIAHHLTAQLGAHELQKSFTQKFESITVEQISDMIAESWAIENCLINKGVHDIFTADCRES